MTKTNQLIQFSLFSLSNRLYPTILQVPNPSHDPKSSGKVGNPAAEEYSLNQATDQYPRTNLHLRNRIQISDPPLVYQGVRGKNVSRTRWWR